MLRFSGKPFSELTLFYLKMLNVNLKSLHVCSISQCSPYFTMVFSPKFINLHASLSASTATYVINPKKNETFL